MNKPEFFKLENAKIDELKDGAGLDTLLLEKEMMKYNGGVDISRFDLLKADNDDLFRQYVPYFEWFPENDRNDFFLKEKRITNAVDKYSLQSPCSMAVDSVEEIEEHMSRIYQVSHFHYILGKKYIGEEDFPDFCCVFSSKAVVLSLISFGYLNASLAYSKTNHHLYVLAPFVLDEIKGAIINDPTSDQLWRCRKPRNSVFVKLGSKWNYKTNWADGGNLFPDRISSMKTIKKHPLIYQIMGDCAEDFFEHAFSNAIKLEL